MTTILSFISTHKWAIAGAAAGAIAGFSYWYFVGCNSGTCMITSKWPNSTLYGAVMGTLLFAGQKKP